MRRVGQEGCKVPRLRPRRPPRHPSVPPSQGGTGGDAHDRGAFLPDPGSPLWGSARVGTGWPACDLQPSGGMRRALRRDLGDFQTPPGPGCRGARTLGPIGRRLASACWSRPAAGATSSTGLLDGPEPPREILGDRDPAGALPRRRGVVAARPPGALRSPSDPLRRASSTSTSAATCDWAAAARCWSSAIPPGSPTPSWAGCRQRHPPAQVECQGARGLDARTGAANFDIAEAVWLKLIASCRATRGSRRPIAILCKCSVARNVLRARGTSVGTADRGASLRRIDALAMVRGRGSTPACSGSPSAASAGRPGPTIPASPASVRDEPRREIGFAGDWLIADLAGLSAVGVRRRHLPAHLAAGAEARRRRRDGIDPSTPHVGPAEPARATRSMSSRMWSIPCSRGPTSLPPAIGDGPARSS